jgi:hypothetical protein
MLYSGQNYEFLFTDSWGELKAAAVEAVQNKNVFRYRARTIKSGDVLEIEIFPIWDTRNEIRSAKAHTTKAAQKNLNEKNARKNLIRKINTNFGEDDYHITLTYGRGVLPTEDQARRDMRNFIKRVRNYHKKNGLPELKYVYVIEFYSGDGRRTRVHHHVIMSGGADRQAIKDLWPHGHRVNVDELEPEAGSLEGLARYITKQQGKLAPSRRWTTSRNLKKPKITTSNTKISKKQAERLAADVKEAAPVIFGKLFGEYTFDDCTVKGSEFVSGAYIYAKMYKTVTWKGVA